MKKILLLSAAVLSILAAVSCAKEEQETENRVVKSKARTTLTATLQSSKTALGDMVAGAWPNFWKTDDQISVNGVISDPLDANYDGQTDASFSFEGLLTPNYYAAYPASAVSGYDQGNATITVPAVQNFANGTYDPAAFIMGGVSDSDALVLSPKVSVIHLSFTGSASICKIKLTGASEAALSGTFSTNFTDFTPVNVSNVVELKAADAIQLPADFFISVPVGLVGALNVTAYDSDGGKMSRNATVKSALAAGQVYSPSALAYTPSYAIEATAEGITSSTAIICWDNCGDEGHCPAYTVSVYSDAGCNDLVASYAVPAGDACWGNEAPRFCISGLAASTTYYVKVINETKGAESNILPVTTAEFNIVEVSNTPAEVGDVILAEDFSELRWDCDMIGVGAGFFPTSQDSFANNEVASYQAAATSNEKTLGSQTTALALSRLAHWAQGAKNNLYIHPGYIKLVGSSNVTHLVTPALNGIPDGMVATVEVEVTASRYYSASSDSYATDKAIVAVQTGDLNELVAGGTNTLDLSSNIANITLPAETAWNTFKVTLNGVSHGDRLAFGAQKDIKKNEARMNISDMKVTVKALYDPDGLAASVKSVSSSTATFTWTHAGSASQDVAKPYRISLYSDSGCENLVVSHEIEAGASCWNSKIPCFIIGGLQPATTYWFIAEDTESGATSEAVNVTTEDFTPVDATTVSDASIGDVILAEDFSEIGWGSDDIGSAAGFVPDTKDTTIPSGINPEGSFVKYDNTGSRYFGAGVILGDSRLSHGWGFFGNSSVYLHNGYSRVGAKGSEGKAARTHIVTPALSGIPEGKLATIEVTVTATKYDSSIDISVFAEKDLTLNSETSPSSSNYRKYTGASLSDGHSFGITTTRSWDTKTVTLTDIDREHQLIIGSLENYKDPADGQYKNRFYISDVKVKITDLIDDPTRKIKDAASLIEFANDVNAGEVDLAAIVTKDITVSAEEADTFNSIVDFAGTLDGNGKTITGLTKPLFDDLKGSVADLTLNSTLNITADQLDLGILANVLSGTADGCTTQGSVIFNVAGGVTGEHHIAGMIGQSLEGSSITNCTNEASVTNETSYAGGNGSELMVGGVLGTFWGIDFTISGCENTGTVINNGAWNKDVSVGGIIGQAGNSTGNSCTMTVSGCTNSGIVTNNGQTTDATNSVGGVIGWIRFGTYNDNSNTGTITNSGNAKQNRVGGLIGYLDQNATFDDNSNSGAVSNTGTASDINYVGGLLGRMQTGNTFKNNSNSGTVSNSGDAINYVYMGGIVGYLDKNNVISDAGNSAKYRLINSGDIENGGSAKNICIGGLFGRNSSGYFNMTGTSSKYSYNSGNITDNSGPAKSNGGDLSIGGIAGYTTTGIKTQYARNTGTIYVTGDKGNTSVNVGGIGGWISNASFNFNNCRNTGDVIVDCTTTASIWAAGIVACPKPNTTEHYYWRSNATIDTHAATVGGENYTAGLMATVEGSDASSTFKMTGHRLAGTIWGSKTTTGLFCCTKNASASFFIKKGDEKNPNMIAPGTVLKDNNREVTINDITDITIGVLAGGAGSTYDITSVIADGHLVIQDW
ncbi:MAG: hypothetical protein IJR01_04175 [Bacteroidales bacterium]|nr:hypothetical protein [Bacteroidales bacterium]